VQPTLYQFLEEQYMNPRKISRRMLAKDSNIARARLNNIFDGKIDATDDENNAIRKSLDKLEAVYMAANPKISENREKNKEFIEFIEGVMTRDMADAIGVDMDDAAHMAHVQKRKRQHQGKVIISGLSKQMVNERLTPLIR
jgi:plasmid maintenance system antidote protein VapI